jgi:hypothetical protein
LPHGNNVEYKHGAKILTQRFAEKDEINYYLSELKLRPAVVVQGKPVNGHLFEFYSSASSKISARPPQKLTFELTHEIVSKSLWHFPTPQPTSDFKTPNASIDLTIVADGISLALPRLYQSELKKDEPSDATFYETLITEISLADFNRFANSKAVVIKFGSLASFELSAEAIAAFSDFAKTVNDTQSW